MRTYLLVAIGGAVGSVLRYALALAFPKPHINAFPWATLCANLVGCFLIGLLAGRLDKSLWLQSTGWFLLATGFCGGFTTFSTFALENIQLLRGHLLLLSLAYLTVSVVSGFLFCIAGYRLTS